MPNTTVRVGAVQAEPVWWDLQGTVQKTVDIILEAGRKGIKVLGFPEVWITGYAWPLWMLPAYENVPFEGEYMQNSMTRDSPEMERIKAACKEADVFAVVGYSERDGGSIYIAQAFISNQGELVHNRRKIKPTHVERVLWGEGQADSLKSVVDTPYGKLGGLNCWENFQPLLRYHEFSQGAQIHVASWPPFPWHPKDCKTPMLYNMSGEASYRMSQNAAMEGQMFVLCSTQVVKEKNHEKLGVQGKGWFIGDAGGFAMIFGPDGLPLVESLDRGEEGILQADIDLKTIDSAKNLCDPVGQYSRPDLLSLLVNTRPAKHVQIRDAA